MRRDAKKKQRKQHNPKPKPNPNKQAKKGYPKKQSKGYNKTLQEEQKGATRRIVAATGGGVASKKAKLRRKGRLSKGR